MANDWSPDTAPYKKSVIQVPDSSSPVKENSPAPKKAYSHTLLFGNVKPKPIFDADGKQINKPAPTTSGGSSLREKFAFNGSNLLQKKAKQFPRDVEILQNSFKGFTSQFIQAVYNSKGNKDLRQTKEILKEIVEKRKQREVLNAMQNDKGSRTSVSKPKQEHDAVEISSSPDVSPRKAVSTKVTLEKKKTISERYSHKLQEQRKIESVVVEDEPAPKKRRLVKGSRDKESLPEANAIVKLSDEEDAEAGNEKEEIILEDDFSDSDVEESALDNQEAFFELKVLEFMNSAEERDIVDITGCTLGIGQAIIEARPFNSIEHFESFNFDPTKKRRNRKTDGELLSSKANIVLRGYAAVESLVKECKIYSDKIASEINKWGVKVQGVDDELEIVDVDLDEEAISTTSKRSGAKASYFKEKPGFLSDSIELKNYQQVGLNWLYLLYRNGLSCILADEMGLGKTCQVIAFLSYLKQLKIDGPHLIVVPASTLENWMREFKKFSPMLVVEPYYGTQAEREEMRDVLHDKWDEIDVLVTTYNLASGSKDDHGFLKHAGFNTIVYDEGHMLKNSASERFHKLMKLKARFRLLLTGTPLQNNLRELMSLLEFILPSIFVSKKEGLKYVFNQRASTNDGHKGYNPLLSERAISKAKKMMAPFILRRRKDQVLQHLPPKEHHIEICDMTDYQAKLYKEKIEFIKALREDERAKTTNVLMLLRKAAIHPMLFRNLYTDELLKRMSKDIMHEDVYKTANETYIYEDMEVMSDFELNALCVQFPDTIGKYQLPDKEFSNSGKIRQLKKILDPIINSKGKVLIFSMFAQVLNILEHVLSSWSIKFLRLDGTTPVEIRQDLIDKFYEEETIPVFLLSTKAGGFGINLVCANHVVIFDQSFNPHDDKQAEDRAHRVGQERPVTITRLISKNSIEENMYLVAQNKLELDKSMSGEQIESNAVSYIEKMIFEDKKVVKIEENGEVKEEFETPEDSEIKSETKPENKPEAEQLITEIKPETEEVITKIKSDAGVKTEIKSEPETKTKIEAPAQDKQNEPIVID